jgi:hypothetical protein
MDKQSSKKQTKRRWGVYALDTVVVLLTIGLVSFGIWSTTQKHTPQGPCPQVGQEHQLTLKNDAFEPNKLDIRQCDVIKIVNLDSQLFVLAFGVHNKHLEYPGFSEQRLEPNEFFSVDAVQAGAYRMHDHLRDNAAVDITIRANDSD